MIDCSTLGIKYMVVDDLPTKGENGVVYIKNMTEEWMYIDNTWIALGNIDTSSELIEDKTDLPTNCKNCGAVLTGHICEYCGTHY